MPEPSASSTPPAPPTRTHDRTGREQFERVEQLLAGVQDLVASLQALGSELEQEVAQVFYGDGTVGDTVQTRLELENARLARALEDRAVIEQAKGMLIAGRGGTAGEAFAVLTAISRREQRSVHDVAAGVVRAGARAGARFAEHHRVDAENPSPAGSSDRGGTTGRIRVAVTSEPAAPSADDAEDAELASPDTPTSATDTTDTTDTGDRADVFDLGDVPASPRSRWRSAVPAHSASRRGPLRYRTTH